MREEGKRTLILLSLMSKCQLEFRGCLLAIDKNPTELGFQQKKKRRRFIVSNNEKSLWGIASSMAGSGCSNIAEPIYLHSSALLHY